MQNREVVASIAQRMDQFEKLGFHTAEDDGHTVWVRLPDNAEGIANQFSQVKTEIEKLYKAFRRSEYYQCMYRGLLHTLAKTHSPIAADAEKFAKIADEMKQQIDEYWELVRRVAVPKSVSTPSAQTPPAQTPPLQVPPVQTTPTPISPNLPGPVAF